MNTLLMRLVGPMQAWGSRSRFDDRDTGLEPTRSGVIGLLCAAVGIPRSQGLQRFETLRMGVRVDAPGRVMVDYHTVQAREAVVSHRHYLADANFLVGWESRDLAFLKEIEQALRNPVWPLFLGRKSFPPSLPVHLPERSVMAGTGLLKALAYCQPGHQPPHRWRVLVEVAAELGEDAWTEDGAHTQGGGDCTVRNDVPLSFADRRFGLRCVRTVWLRPDRAPQKGGDGCTCPG